MSTTSISNTGSISSAGIGSGLDVTSIITGLMQVEKKPLTDLQTKASSIQTTISAFGEVKSALATFRDAAAALDDVNGKRAVFGATQNRFSAVITNLQTSVENQSAARSRIMDADFAAETAALSRAQILQQAGTAMVAQANQVPQQVLKLLQG